MSSLDPWNQNRCRSYVCLRMLTYRYCSRIMSSAARGQTKGLLIIHRKPKLGHPVFEACQRAFFRVAPTKQNAVQMIGDTSRRTVSLHQPLNTTHNSNDTPDTTEEAQAHGSTYSSWFASLHCFAATMETSGRLPLVRHLWSVVFGGLTWLYSLLSAPAVSIGGMNVPFAVPVVPGVAALITHIIPFFLSVLVPQICKYSLPS
ncbi:hypothetical protein GGR56DRAFT_647849, partial [Xylariaceae sp. FL0804]